MVDVNKDVICTYKVECAREMANSEVRRELENNFNVTHFWGDNQIELLHKLDDYYVAQIRTINKHK